MCSECGHRFCTRYGVGCMGCAAGLRDEGFLSRLPLPFQDGHCPDA
jgi:hypothetical protein